MSTRHEKVVYEAIREAIERAGGTQAALAWRLGCSRQNVNLMLKHRRVAIQRAVQIERLLGVSRERLAPHAYE